MNVRGKTVRRALAILSRYPSFLSALHPGHADAVAAELKHAHGLGTLLSAVVPGNGTSEKWNKGAEDL